MDNMLRLALTSPNSLNGKVSTYCFSRSAPLQEIMSLDTLLEAAKFVELQDEWKEQQQKRQSYLTPLVTTHPQPSRPVITSQHIIRQPTAVLKQSKIDAILPTILQQPQQQQQQPQPQQQQQLQQQLPRLIHNSFDIINPLIIDEDGEQKRKQPPLVFRAGTREVHNKLEKHRRAHLKECFDFLKKQLPTQLDEKKTSNLNILHSALRYIHGLKRKERELEHEMEKLARRKIQFQQRLAVLKKEVSAQCDIDFSTLIPEPASGAISGTTSSIIKVQELKPVISTPPQLVPAKHPGLSITALPLTNGIKEQVQAAALSMLPVAGYPVSQSIVVHKLAIVPKGITDITNPLAHFITTPTQPLNGKVLPMVNTQYVVKPVVVVSSPPSITPRHS